MNYNECLKIFLNTLEKDFAFDAMAIRVLDPMGYLPFAVHNGLPDALIEDEELITTNDCLCGKVSRLETQNGSPLFTKRGSFWCNSVNDNVMEELRHYGIETRGRCLKEGYKTLLIIPINADNGARGNLYFASKKENLLTKSDVTLLEKRAMRLADDVFKHITECEKYNIIVRFIAQCNDKDKKAFAKYFKHIKNCSTCHEFYSYNSAFENLIQNSMTETPFPLELQSKIIKGLAQYNA